MNIGRLHFDKKKELTDFIYLRGLIKYNNGNEDKKLIKRITNIPSLPCFDQYDNSFEEYTEDIHRTMFSGI